MTTIFGPIHLFSTTKRLFSPNDYLLGDSAFGASTIMVPAFKKPPRGMLALRKNMFNTWLAKAGIKPEHFNGLLKAQRSWLVEGMKELILVFELQLT